MEFAAPHNFCKIQSIFGKWKAAESRRLGGIALINLLEQRKAPQCRFRRNQNVTKRRLDVQQAICSYEQ
jgi:hypothetical protein